MARAPESEDESEDVVAFTVRWPRALRDEMKSQSEKEERAFNTVIIRAARAYLKDPGAADKKGR